MKKQKILLLTIMLILVFCFMSCDSDVCCYDVAYTISGKVVDSLSLSPIDSCVVSFDDTTDIISEPFLTDINGNYFIPLYGSNTTIFIRKQNYKTKWRNLQNVTGDLFDVNFELVPN